MTLQTFVDVPNFLAVEQTSSTVHVVPADRPLASALCGLRPEGQWERVWKEPVSRLSRPIGLCRSCWHRTRERTVTSPATR